MTPLPQIDVIILSWNRIDDTLAAIASAAEQQDVDQRILVVDQGSEPQNLARLEAYVASLPCARLTKLSQNCGVPGGRNLAAAMGCAPYIVALDSDAVFADRKTLARAAAHLEANPNLCAIAFRILNYYTREVDWTSWDYPSAFSPNQAFACTRFVGAGHAVRRSTFEAVGAYDARLGFCGEELDLCYRMINTGLRIEYVPSIEILHKTSHEHRVFWGRGRYFQTVRNNLYTLYKFQTPWPRLAVAAAAFVMKGMRNGMATQALRGSFASIAMCHAFARADTNKAAYALRDETWRYIHACEPSRREPWLVKMRRQFVHLPH